jgi:hypothetical protein
MIAKGSASSARAERVGATCDAWGVLRSVTRLASSLRSAWTPGVLEQFRKEARRRRIGHETLINEVLARHVGQDVA